MSNILFLIIYTTHTDLRRGILDHPLGKLTFCH